MRLTDRLVERFEGRGLPARSVRLRLTALYGGLFVVCGAGLLVITYLLVSHSTRHRPAGGVVSGHPFAGWGELSAQSRSAGSRPRWATRTALICTSCSSSPRPRSP